MQIRTVREDAGELELMLGDSRVSIKTKDKKQCPLVLKQLQMNGFLDFIAQNPPEGEVRVRVGGDGDPRGRIQIHNGGVDSSMFGAFYPARSESELTPYAEIKRVQRQLSDFLGKTFRSQVRVPYRTFSVDAHLLGEPVEGVAETLAVLNVECHDELRIPELLEYFVDEACPDSPGHQMKRVWEVAYLSLGYLRAPVEGKEKLGYLADALKQTRRKAQQLHLMYYGSPSFDERVQIADAYMATDLYRNVFVDDPAEMMALLTDVFQYGYLPGSDKAFGTDIIRKVHVRKAPKVTTTK